MFSRWKFETIAVRPAWIAALPLPALLLVYPLVWCGGRNFAELPFFTPAALTLLGMLLLTLDERRLYEFFWRESTPVRRVVYGCIPAAVVALLHYYRWRDPELLLRALFPLVLPLFAALYWREWFRLLPWTAALLGAADLAVLLVEKRQGGMPFGLTGNWNWSATLLIAGVTAGVYLIRRRWYWIGIVLGGGLAAWLFGDWLSRAAVAAAAAAGVLPLLRIRGRRRAAAAAGLAAVLLATGIGFHLRRPDAAADGVRRELAAATLRLIGERPWLGVGPGRFESEIRPFLSVSYHALPVAAERTVHPHNELLFLGATYGVSGLLLSAALLYAAWEAFRRWRRSDAADATRPPAEFALWLFALLLLHGMVDVVLANWPGDLLFALTAGALWGYAADGATGCPAPAAPEMERSRVRWPLIAVRVLLALLLAAMLVRDFRSARQARQARLAAAAGDFAAAGEHWRQSRQIRPTAHNLYGAAMHALFHEKNPERTLQLLTELELRTGMTDLLHAQSLRARALAAAGREEESLPFFAAEQRNFPFGVTNLVLWRQVLLRLGRTDAAAALEPRIADRLRRLRLTAAELPLLRRNPEWELHPERVPAALRRPSEEVTHE